MSSQFIYDDEEPDWSYFYFLLKPSKYDNLKYKKKNSDKDAWKIKVNINK